MLTEIDAVLRRAGGVATRQRLLTVVTRGQLDHEVRSGQLVSPFPRALCRPWDADQPSIVRRAALTSAGPPATLSHTSALETWAVPAAAIESSAHVSVPAKRSPRSRPGLTIHRVDSFPPVGKVNSPITTTAPEAIVEAWPLLIPSERRGPAITAVRRRLTTPGKIDRALVRRSRTSDRAALADLIVLRGTRDVEGCRRQLLAILARRSR